MSDARQRKNPTGEADPMIGEVLGSFRVERVLGRGAMGTVYFGVHTVIGSKVAIKVMHAELADQSQSVARFQSEARAVNLVGHENIVSIYDLSVLPPNRPYMVMEYLEGRPLSALMEKPMEPKTLLPLLIQACSGLHAAHLQGVIHRDLKPDNIFLVDRPGRSGLVVKLLDFGVAKLFEVTEETQERTQAGMMLGTPAYMAPEQWGSSDVDARSDVYSLGITAWRALTGELPFKGKSMVDLMVAHRTHGARPPHELNPKVPPQLSQVILKAIAKAPDDRFRTAEEMQRALEEVSAGLGLHGGTHQQASFAERPQVKALGPKHEELRRFDFLELTRAGVFLSCEPPFPEIFTRMQLELPAPDQPLRVQAEVVRHVTPEQAKAWGMKPGMGVQFVALPDHAKQVLKAWLSAPTAKPTPVPAGGSIAPTIEPVLDPSQFSSTRAGSHDEAWANRVDDLLDSWVERGYGNHYQVLKLRPDASFDEIRAQAADLIRQFAGGTSSGLTQTQSKQLQGALDRIRSAAKMLLDARTRAAYDAELGNFRGVARCMAAGLSPRELEELRRAYLAAHPLVANTARVAIETADPLLAQGMREVAKQLYERALQQDPLNAELHARVQRAESGSGSFTFP